MFDIIRNNPSKSLMVMLIPAIIAIIALVLVLDYSLERNDGYVGALLDDTWIHIRYAMSVSEGRGLMYNEGALSTGDTSPLWVLILGAIYAVTNPDLDQQIRIAVGLSAIGQVLTVLAVTGFGWWATRHAWIGLLAGIITAVTGRLMWMALSGMETTLFTALCIVALWSHMADIRARRVFGWRTGIITAAATLTRPEGYLLAALIGFDSFVVVPLLLERTSGFWRRVRAGWRGITAYILLAGSYPLVCLALTGYPLPNTFRVKSQLGREWPELPRTYFWTPNTDHGPVLILLAGLGIGYLLWHSRRDKLGIVWALWPVFFVLAVLFLGAQHFIVNNGRYVAPAIPFHALVAAIGTWVIMGYLRTSVRWAGIPRLPGTMGLGLAATLIAMTLLKGFNPSDQSFNQAWRVAQDTAQLRAMHVAAGNWLAETTQPRDLIALNDVGAIVHIADRPVLDMVGLVSPQVIDAVDGNARGSCIYDLALARLMLDEPPTLIGVFPWWFPCLTAWPDALQPYNVFTITGSTVIGGGELVFYWPVWEKWPVQREIPSGASPLNAAFEHGISLNSYQVEPIEGGLQVTLWWHVHAQPPDDYTVFVHLIDPDGQILSQHDSRPQDGHFNTAWWRPGDIIRDTRLIPLADPTLLERDDLRLRIGLYPTGGGPNLLRPDAPAGEEEFVLIPLAE